MGSETVTFWQIIFAGIAYFIFVFLKAFQQRNVAFLHYKYVIPVSILMAAAEVYIIASVARAGWSFLAVLSIGLGGGFGALAAMYVHNKLTERKENHE